MTTSKGTHMGGYARTVYSIIRTRHVVQLSFLGDANAPATVDTLNHSPQQLYVTHISVIGHDALAGPEIQPTRLAALIYWGPTEQYLASLSSLPRNIRVVKIPSTECPPRRITEYVLRTPYIPVQEPTPPPLLYSLAAERWTTSINQ